MSQFFRSVAGSGGGAIESITPDSGGAVFADGSFNINLFGTSAQGLSFAGNPGTHTITGTIADWTTAQKGVGVLSTNAQAIAGSGTTQAVTPAALGAKLGAQTANGIGYGAGTASALSWTAAGTNGQVIIAATAGAPAFATIGSGTAVSWTLGANTLSLSVSGGGVAVTAVAGISASLAANTCLIPQNAALSTFTLPATATVGDVLKIAGKGGGGWIIAQNAGQTIHFNSSNTTTGVGGSVASTNQYNCITLRCITTNTDFVVEASEGTFTVV